MKKRLLSALLCICMLLGMMPAAFAAVVQVEDTETLWDEETQSFRIYKDYWAKIVETEPNGYAADTKQKTVTISTPEALAWWAKQVNGGAPFAGYTVTIANDLNMSGHYWTPIDTATIAYSTGEDGSVSWTTVDPQKKLDGVTITGGTEGHTITGIATVTGIRSPAQPSEPGDGQNCYYYSAFIGRNDGTLTIENLTFDRASIAIAEPAAGVSSNGTSMCAVVTAINTGTLTLNSVNVTNSRVLAMQKAAAFLGMPDSGCKFTVNQCAVTGCTISAYFQVAPVVGYASQDDVSIQGVRLENNTVWVIEQQGKTGRTGRTKTGISTIITRTPAGRSTPAKWVCSTTGKRMLPWTVLCPAWSPKRAAMSMTPSPPPSPPPRTATR